MEIYKKIKKKLEEKGCYKVSIEEDGIYISHFPAKSMIPFQVIKDMIEYHGEESLINGIYDLLLKNR